MKKTVIAGALLLAAGGTWAVDVGSFVNPSKDHRPETWFHLIGGNVAKAGLAGSRYSKTPDAGFVNDELVKAVRDEIQKARYFRVRERPAPGSCTNAVRRR